MARQGRPEGPEIRFLCPAHNDHHPSARWHPQKGTWCCDACKVGGGTIDLAKRLGVTMPGRQNNQVKRRIVATYDYQDEHGQLLFQTVRFQPKDFQQRQPDGQGNWIYNLKGVQRVLYHLPELLKADPDQWIFVAEGEKDCNNLALHGLVGTTNPGGAGKWRAEYAGYFQNRRVVILPDNDPPDPKTNRRPGIDHAQKGAASLYTVATELKVLELPGLPTKGDVSDWLDAGHTAAELLALVDAAPLWQPSVNFNPSDFPLTDAGNAEFFAHLYGDRLRYDHARGQFLLWCTHWWKPDSDGEVGRLALGAVRARRQAAASINDPETSKRAYHWAISSESRSRFDALTSIARALRPVADAGECWDLNPWLLGVGNGVVDLTTGRLRSGQQSDCITKHTCVDYNVGATCPTWLEFLDRIMAGNETLIRFLQRAVGYSLTGIVTERVLFILHGQGANGKSTFLEAIRDLLGGYALRTPTETLMMKQQAGIPNDIARLRGARFVFASETEGGRRLAESLIKDMTGNDVLSARFMRAEFFDFKPEFKIWMGTNHKPEIRGTDNAIWDRLKLVPFAVCIPEQERDKHLIEKLRGELPGILQWAIAGCLDWQENGLGVPDEVRRATAGYREEQDTLASFIGEHCVIKQGCKVGSTVLYKAYVVWCEEGKEKPEKQTAMGLRLRERGFTSERTGPGGIAEWYGIGLVDHSLPLEGLRGSEAFFPINPYEDSTAGMNRKSGSQPLNPSKSPPGGYMSEQHSFLDEQPVITVPTMQKTVDRAAMQEAVDAGHTRAEAVDMATIYNEPNTEPEYLEPEDYDNQEVTIDRGEL
jgi:putative DNA primase/helicase